MISKILFMETLDEIQTETKRYEKFDKLMREYCDGFPVMTLGNKYLNQLIAVLKETSDDTGDLIEWWLYEKVDKIVWLEAPCGRKIEYDLTQPRLYTTSLRCVRKKRLKRNEVMAYANVF